MLKIGIVGAENSHCQRIATLCNVDKAVACRVVSVWGEKVKFAKDAAEKCDIPAVVKDWREMLGAVDGVMIDHRHAKEHYPVAKFFVENGVPCFVDKPFTYTLAEGKRLCALAREKGVPITSFSVKVLQEPFKQFAQALKKAGKVAFLTSTGPADIKSKYGGIFFYGIHQVDPVVELFGNQAETAQLRRHGQNGVATITYKDGPVVTINCNKDGLFEFHCSAVGDQEIVDWRFARDPNPYIAGLKIFTSMFRTGKEPIPHERMLAPIAILEALDKSLATGKVVRVKKVAMEG